MSTSTKSLSASYVAVRFGVTEKTARLFMLKIREAMESSGNNPMTGIVHVLITKLQNPLLYFKKTRI